MKKKRIGLIILLVIVGILLIGQFFQPEDNNGVRTGPDDITKAVTVPADVQKVLDRSCYDCHSDKTTYWWYDRVFPINWWIYDHIQDGKKELNFTVFNTYSDRKKNKKIEEIAEEVEKGKMPLKSYTFMHGEARLSEADRQLLVNWAKGLAPTGTVGQEGAEEGEGH